jgi:hypothetical protein
LVEEKMISSSGEEQYFLTRSKIWSAFVLSSTATPAIGSWQLAIGKISFRAPVGPDFSS